MNTFPKSLALVAAMSTFGWPAYADGDANEDSVQLKSGEGVEIVEQNCITCHSLDYIQMNSPFLDEKGWTAEVTKMVNVFGAPVEEADQRKIVEYLIANYGKP